MSHAARPLRSWLIFDVGQIREREMQLMVFLRKAELVWKFHAELQSSASGNVHLEEFE
jgi:hypothetical protein